MDGKVNLKVTKPLILQHANLIQPLARTTGVEKAQKGVNDVHTSLHYLLAELYQGKPDRSLDHGGDHAKVGAGSSSLPRFTEVRIPSSSSQGAKPSRKCWKDRKKSKKMVVGEDVSMDELPELIGKTTAGRFCG